MYVQSDHLTNENGQGCSDTQLGLAINDDRIPSIIEDHRVSDIVYLKNLNLKNTKAQKLNWSG